MIKVPAMAGRSEVRFTWAPLREVGDVTVDIAYGGMWYVVVDAARVGLDLCPEQGRSICRFGEIAKAPGLPACLSLS